MQAKIYNQKAEEVGKIILPKDIFDLPRNDNLIYQVVTSMQSNKRTPLAHAKTRGEVSGSGRKPWVQKGTGRARHGSVRSPIWVGGGVAHGPSKEKKYSKKINKKMKQKAFFTVLSQKIQDSEILLLDKILLSQVKTKEAAKILNNISHIKGFEKLIEKGKSIFIFPREDKEIIRGFRNIPAIKILDARNLNVLDLLSYKYLIIIQPKEFISFLRERKYKKCHDIS